MEQNSDGNFTTKLFETGNNGLKRKAQRAAAAFRQWRNGVAARPFNPRRSLATFSVKWRACAEWDTGRRDSRNKPEKLASLRRIPVQTRPVKYLVSERHWTNTQTLCPYCCRLQYAERQRPTRVLESNFVPRQPDSNWLAHIDTWTAGNRGHGLFRFQFHFVVFTEILHHAIRPRE